MGESGLESRIVKRKVLNTVDVSHFNELVEITKDNVKSGVFNTVYQLCAVAEGLLSVVGYEREGNKFYEKLRNPSDKFRKHFKTAWAYFKREVVRLADEAFNI